MRIGKLAFPLLLLLLTGCGYRLAARKGDVGKGRTIAVPTFANKSTGYRIEQRVSEAIRRELVRQTHYTVTSAETADVVVTGEVLNYSNTSPSVFAPSGRASQYVIAMDLKIQATETATGKVLFRNDLMTFRDSFQLSQSPAEFVPEDPAAIDRFTARFASSFVASLVHGQQ